MKRITWIFVMTLVIASMLLAGCGDSDTSPNKESIRVGMSRSLTGPLATIGDSAFRPVYEKWVSLVNASGGVYVEEYGKKLPIELIIYDDESDMDKMLALTEKLILEDKVDFLWPACSTDMIFAQAPVANEHGYLHITAEGGAAEFANALADFPYTFVTLSYSDWNQMPVLTDILVDKGATSVYVAAIADLHGMEYTESAIREFGRVGIEVVGNRSVDMATSDFSPIIKAAAASGADAFLCFGYPDQVMPALGASIELGYNPKVWLGGPGVNFDFFYGAFGPATDGVLGWTMFARGITPTLDELAYTLYEGDSNVPQDWWGHPCYWASLDIWKGAIEKAGTLDQKTIRDIIATEHFDTVLGDTWFTIVGEGGGILAKECHTGEIGQWQNGVYQVVGPYDKATSEFVYPKPEW